MSKVIVTGIKSYSFKKDDGQVLEGVKVSYIGEVRASKQNENGYLPLQSSLNLECVKDFKEIPGLYDVKYDMVPGKGNKPTFAISGFNFIKPVNIGELFK